MTRQEAKDAIALLITDPENEQNTPALVRQALGIIIDAEYNSADDGVPITSQQYGFSSYAEVEISSAQILSMGSNPIDLLPPLSAGQYYDAKVILEFSPGNQLYNLDNDFPLVDLNKAYAGVIRNSLIRSASNAVAVITDLIISTPDTISGAVVRSIMLNEGSLTLRTYNETDPVDGNGTLLAKIWYNIRTFGTES